MRPDGKLTDKQRKHYIALCHLAKKGIKNGAEEMTFLSTLSAYVRAHVAPEPEAGTPEARFHCLLDELAKRFPNAPIDPSSSSVVPEHVYLREIDLLLLLRKS